MTFAFWTFGFLESTTFVCQNLCFLLLEKRLYSNGHKPLGRGNWLRSCCHKKLCTNPSGLAVFLQLSFRAFHVIVLRGPGPLLARNRSLANFFASCWKVQPLPFWLVQYAGASPTTDRTTLQLYTILYQIDRTLPRTRSLHLWDTEIYNLVRSSYWCRTLHFSPTTWHESFYDCTPFVSKWENSARDQVPALVRIIRTSTI